ncbi:Prophage tail protein [Snodgrassella communis]|uniref:YmfQ family protein n=1 Tax=Snodgrassella communis TaxID=2946699 RepID=UPI0004615DAE|nr:YmfQ family protein [Snodgrassella communis]KDN12552.1 Prophage tail protein [Snodgrassella communis]
MNYTDTLLRLLPPIAYNRTALAVRNAARIDGNCLDEVQNAARRKLGVIDPRTSGNYIVRWEEVLNLDSNGKNGQQRIQAVIAKINETGGLSIPYFKKMAASIGYDVNITEPQPFRAGISRAGERLTREDIMWVWWVNIKNADNHTTNFRAGISAAGDRLAAYGDVIIENILKELKPAFTDIRFTYKDK